MDLKNAFDVYSGSDTVKIPLVICDERNEKAGAFCGFVPGLVMKDISSKYLESCKKRLLAVVKVKVLNMIKNGEPFPFFPDEKEIREDFKNVVDINYIKLHKNKK